jgi:integrase
VRRVACKAAVAGLLSPEHAAGIRRIKCVKKSGVRPENRLTAEEARRFWQAPDAGTLKGKRDRAILAVLPGCGLRRRELAYLEFTHLQQTLGDSRSGWQRRSPPNRADAGRVNATWANWIGAAELSGAKLFRCVCRAGKCRGTALPSECAKFCHCAGGELEQIQFLLGHVSVQTTQPYLGCKQRIPGAVNDCIGIEP